MSTLTPSRTTSSITTTSTSNSLTGSITPTPTTTTSSNVLTFGNLFPTPTNTTSPLPSRPALSQNVLMWIFAVIAVSLLSLIVIWRYCCSKIQRKFRGNRSFAGSTGRSRFGFGRTGNGYGDGGLERPQTALLRNHSDMEAQHWDHHHHHHHHHHQHHRHRSPVVLSAPFLHTGLVPLVSQEGVLLDESRLGLGGRHRYGGGPTPPTRGADIDSGGRRGGGSGGADSVLGSYALEELPAYEAGKSPPGYHHAVTSGAAGASPVVTGDTRSPSSSSSPSPPPPPPPPPPPIPYSQRPHIEETEIGNLIPGRPS